MFHLKKWYFDFLTPEKQYVFIYYASARLGPGIMRSLTLHLAWPRQGVLVARSIPVTGALELAADGEIVRALFGRITCGKSEAMLAITDGDCAVQLRYKAEPGPELRPVVIPTGKRSSVSWKPFGLKYRVSGFVALAQHRVEVKDALGYIDYLESSCLPPLVPVRTLYWGRLAQPDLQIVFMRAATRNGTKAWSALYGCTNSMQFESERVVIQPERKLVSGQPEGNGYSLRADWSVGAVEMQVRHEAVVQEGSFIEQQEHASKLGRRILKLLTRNPRSTKFLSSADVHCQFSCVSQQIRDVPIIDEYVLL